MRRKIVLLVDDLGLTPERVTALQEQLRSFTNQLGPDDDAQIPAIFRDLTDKEKQGISAAYYTSTEFMDHNVGRVLTAVEKAGLAGRTLVVYNGDHGYMLGQHGRFEKHCSFEPAIRAPLLMRWSTTSQLNCSTRSRAEPVPISRGPQSPLETPVKSSAVIQPCR